MCSRAFAFLILVIMLIVVSPLLVAVSPPVGAVESGQVLYSPNLKVHPKGKAGYPRGIQLQYGAGSGTLLATFAREGEHAPTSLPIFRSGDQGKTWSLISSIRSHTDGWDIEAPTLFEVPFTRNGLKAGDILAAGTAWKRKNYTAQKIEVFLSRDQGKSWEYLSNCTETKNLPNTWGHGIWEPAFLMTSDGRVGCYISDERPANSRTNNQVIGHYLSRDGARTWEPNFTQDVAFPADNLQRPGMQTFAKLPDGRTVMSYELCRDATDPDHACEVFIKFSEDGFHWGPLDDPGILVSTADHRHLLHTPLISWMKGGGPHGTLVLTGQRVTAGHVGDERVLEESGSVMLVNTSMGKGDWREVALPLSVVPTGAYAEGLPSCPGYSSPVIPLAENGDYVYLAATWLGVGDQCEIRFARGKLPLNTGQLVGPGQQCLDVDTNTSRNGNPVQLWNCNEASGQRWNLTPDGAIESLGKCLDVDAQGTSNFTKVQLWECNGTGAQKWKLRADGSLFNPQSAKCLDAPQGRVENGTHLQIYECNGLWTQRWRLSRR